MFQLDKIVYLWKTLESIRSLIGQESEMPTLIDWKTLQKVSRFQNKGLLFLRTQYRKLMNALKCVHYHM